MSVRELLADPARKFQRLPEPANPSSIETLRHRAPMSLPDGYLELLAASNGAEGELAVEPGWFQFWHAEEVLPLNQGYEVANFHPGFFGFGSSGGGVMLCFSIAHGPASQVFGIPFDSIDPEDVQAIAPSFESFLLALGQPCPR